MLRHPHLLSAARWAALGLILGGVACGYSSTTSANGPVLAVQTMTTGANPDPDGYSLSVDGGAAQLLMVNGTLQLKNLTAASHTLALSGLAANCTLAGTNPRPVDLSQYGAPQNVDFQISCP